MNRIVYSSIALLALASSAQPLSAADVPAKPITKAAAVAAPAFSWAGPYAGLHCGAAWARTATSGSDGAFDEPPTTITIRDTGWLCGAQAGYNWQSAAWVYGVEGDLGYLKSQDTEVIGIDDYFAGVRYNSWYGTLTGRIGPVWDRSMLYLKGGLAVARINNFGGDVTPEDPDLSDLTSVTKTKWGWALGLGFEQALQPNWSWKVEYLYLDFGKTTSGNQDGDSYEHRNRMHTVKLGLNYHFATGTQPMMTKY